MKLIRDIRLFELDVHNGGGNSYIGRTYRYNDKVIQNVIQRLLFLLRHRGFGFEDFDHLYVNFTPCLPHRQVQDVNSSNIREFAWLHYVDVGCDIDVFNGLDLKEKTAFVLECIKKAALLKAPEESRALFTRTFDEVLEQGEYLLLPYKQKENENFRVEIFVQISDDLDFLPLIRVSDREGNLVAAQRLRAYGRDEFITQISTISIGRKSLRITPRKNWDTEYYGLKPIKLEW